MEIAGLLAVVFGDVSPLWIPIVALVAGAVIAVGCTAIISHAKQQLQRLDYELQLRRMEHERRMKELEVELAKVRESRGAGTPA